MLGAPSPVLGGSFSQPHTPTTSTCHTVAARGRTRDADAAVSLVKAAASHQRVERRSDALEALRPKHRKREATVYRELLLSDFPSRRPRQLPRTPEAGGETQPDHQHRPACEPLRQPRARGILPNICPTLPNRRMRSRTAGCAGRKIGIGRRGRPAGPLPHETGGTW